MGTRMLVGLVGLFLLLPVSAAAQEVDLEELCYVDPTAPECVDVGGVVEERPTPAPTPAPPTGIGGAEEEVDVAVLGVTQERGVLAFGGAQLTGIAVLAAVLLAIGAMLLTAGRRRSRAGTDG
jgi:hypothetical protein